MVSSTLSLTLLVGTWYVFRQPSFGVLNPIAGVSASSSNLEAHVHFLTTEVSPRGVNWSENLERAADYLFEQFAATSDRVERQDFLADGDSYLNIVAEYGPGSGPVVVLGAHYDAMTLFGDNPGADDNASGTAGILELGRLLGEQAPSMRVMIVAYSLEEPPYFASPLMGSRIHADSLVERGLDVWGVINLEMIGYFSEVQPWPSMLLDLLYPDSGDFIAVVGRYEDRRLARHVKHSFRGATFVPAYSYTGPRVLGTDASDHRNYWLHGFEAIMVTDTAFARNPNYHAASDTAETLDFERMAGVVDGVFNSVLQAEVR